MEWNIFQERKSYKELERHPAAPDNNLQLPAAFSQVSICKQEARPLEIPCRGELEPRELCYLVWFLPHQLVHFGGGEGRDSHLAANAYLFSESFLNTAHRPAEGPHSNVSGRAMARHDRGGRARTLTPTPWRHRTGRERQHPPCRCSRPDNF